MKGSRLKCWICERSRRLTAKASATSVRKTGRLVVVHEACKTAGPGAEIAQSAMEGAFDYLQAPVLRVTAKDVPIPTGKLQDEVFPSTAHIEEAIRTVMQ